MNYMTDIVEEQRSQSEADAAYCLQVLQVLARRTAENGGSVVNYMTDIVEEQRSQSEADAAEGPLAQLVRASDS